MHAGAFASGGQPWGGLQLLGQLPLTAIMSLHALCTWLVGQRFKDLPDLGGQVQVGPRDER